MSNEASYVFGQCTYFVARELSWIPGGLGNAGDWFSGAQAKGLSTTNIPTPGAAVVYGSGHGYSPFGHVAIVQSLNGDGTFNVREMNYTGWNQVSTRRSTMTDVEGFILPPGTSASKAAQGMAFGGAFNLPATPNVAGDVSGAIGTLTAPFVSISNSFKTVSDDVDRGVKWVSDTTNWWRIGFIALGVALIWWGVDAYFFQEVTEGASSPQAKRAVEVAALA